MARETKTVQCYPDDDIVNKKIKLFESFGWELINNQRCQEFDGQTKSYDFDGSTTVTNHYSTFNKLTFSREKSSSWYSEVAALEAEHDKLMSSKPVFYGAKPTWKILLISIMLAVIGIGVFFFLFGISTYAIIAPAIMWGISVLLIVVYIVKRTRYSKDYDYYLSRKREWESTSEKEAQILVAKAAALVNGD